MKLLIASILFMASATAFAGDIKLNITGCTPGKDVRVALYSTPEDFSKNTAGMNARTQVKKAEGNYVDISFIGLPAGKYAIAVFSDSNGNQKLDSNILGMPTEPYGFSNEARNLTSKPSFEQAAFEVGGGVIEQTIQLK